MGPRPGSGQPVVAVVTFLVAALAFVPLGIALHYLAVPEAPSPGDAGRAAVASVAAAVNAALVYGPVYGALGRRLPTGFGAPVAAFVGALLPVAARLLAFPRPGGAPAGFVVAHALLVELALGLALALLSLGTSRPLAAASAAALLWGFRILVHPFFIGGVVPVLELFSGIAAVVAVSLVLKSALAPHRDALLEVP